MLGVLRTTDACENLDTNTSCTHTTNTKTRVIVEVATGVIIITSPRAIDLGFTEEQAEKRTSPQQPREAHAVLCQTIKPLCRRPTVLILMTSSEEDICKTHADEAEPPITGHRHRLNDKTTTPTLQ